jgi:beta-lactam-binding protein with PASTA domain
MSFRNANMILRQYGLRLEDTLFKPDFAKNSVLDQVYKGETIKPGTQIQQGSSITLVLGSGIGGAGFVVPDLFGLTYQQAKSRLDSMGLTFGSVASDNDVRDTTIGYIRRQVPEQFGEGGVPNRIRPGQTVDIWLGAQKLERKADSTVAPTAPGGN